MFDIVTIGSATRDVFVEGDFPTIPWKGTPSGRAYALPRGEKLEIGRLFFTLGGNGANAAVTFARQGFGTACVARVGEDAGGHEAIRRLRAEKVTPHIAIDRSKPTSYSLLILEKGERTILNYKGASHAFSLRDVPLGKIRARWWYVSLPGESDAMFPKLVTAAHRMGVKIGMNPTGYHLHHRRADIVRALPEISFLVMNDEEASWLTGIYFKKREEIVRWVSRRMGPDGIFAMTLGPEGSWIAHEGKLYRAGIFKEKKIEDRTGAGDSWGAGFVAGLMAKSKMKNRKSKSEAAAQMFQGDDIRYAIRLASANATANVEKIGATEGTLTRRQFEKEARWKKFPVKVAKI